MSQAHLQPTVVLASGIKHRDSWILEFSLTRPCRSSLCLPQTTWQNTIPYCAFNGGSDVWVDVGNKLIGVQVMQKLLGASPAETAHIGDQFLSTGNDISTRLGCATVWIASPAETESFLRILIKDLRKKSTVARTIEELHLAIE